MSVDMGLLGDRNSDAISLPIHISPFEKLYFTWYTDSSVTSKGKDKLPFVIVFLLLIGVLIKFSADWDNLRNRGTPSERLAIVVACLVGWPFMAGFVQYLLLSPGGMNLPQVIVVWSIGGLFTFAIVDCLRNFIVGKQDQSTDITD